MSVQNCNLMWSNTNKNTQPMKNENPKTKKIPALTCVSTLGLLPTLMFIQRLSFIALCSNVKTNMQTQVQIHDMSMKP